MAINKEPPADEHRSILLGNRAHALCTFAIVAIVILAFAGGYLVARQQILYAVSSGVPTRFQPADLSQVTSFPCIHPFAIQSDHPTFTPTKFQTLQPTSSALSPTPTPVPISKHFTWKTYTYNDPVFGMTFQYPSFWTLQEDKWPYETHPGTAYPAPVNLYREVYDVSNPYRYYNSVTALSYNWLKSDQPDSLEALQSIYNSRSLNDVSKSIYFYSPDELHNRWLAPIDMHYVENKDGTLRGLSFVAFNHANGIPDNLELDGLNIFLTDGRSIVIKVQVYDRIAGLNNVNPSMSLATDNVQPVSCGAGVNPDTNNTIKCFINREAYSYFGSICNKIAESVARN